MEEPKPKPKPRRPAAVRKPAAAPAPRAPKTEQDWQDGLDKYLRDAQKAGQSPWRMLVRASADWGAKRALGLFDRGVNIVGDLIEGKRK